MQHVKQPDDFGNCMIVAMVAIILYSYIGDQLYLFANGTREILKKDLREGSIVCERMTKKLIDDIKPTSSESLPTMLTTLKMTSKILWAQPTVEKIDSCDADVLLFHQKRTIINPVLSTSKYELAGAIMGHQDLHSSRGLNDSGPIDGKGNMLSQSCVEVKICLCIWVTRIICVL